MTFAIFFDKLLHPGASNLYRVPTHLEFEPVGLHVLDHLLDETIFRVIVASGVVAALSKVEDLELAVDEESRKAFGALLAELAVRSRVVHLHVEGRGEIRMRIPEHVDDSSLAVTADLEGAR